MKAYKKVSILFCFIIFITCFIYWSNNSIVTTTYEIVNDKIPNNFKNYKIVQISDLHSKEFGANNNKLINKIDNINPNIIVITGDLIDKSRVDLNIISNLIEQLSNKYPIYYITGNHENWSGAYNELKEILNKNGVTILDDKSVELKEGNESITLTGIDDLAFRQDMSSDDFMDIILNNTDDAKFNILLSHRPELFYYYVETNADLVLTGHAHGGQFRLPFIGGLVAPNQGLLPEYTSGIHEKNNTSMVISRGLGNSIIPVRLFNRPELVTITLNK